jgi:hypothetical protein
MLLSMGSAQAQVPLVVQSQEQNVKLMGQLGGSVWGVAVDGANAYIGVGPRLMIVNIMDPAAPIVTAETEPFPGVVNSITKAGSYAYVADGEGGLRIINVSMADAPFEAGYLDTPGQAQSVAVSESGNYAYVADLDHGLRIINISNRANPFEVGSLNPAGLGDWAYTVKVAGSYAYVGGSDGLRSINISNPAQPTLADFFEILGGSSYKGVALAGNNAYVADGNLLRIININNPADLFQAGFYDPPGSEYPYTVFISGNYVYLGIGDSGVRLVNVTNPASPSGAGSVDTPGYAWELAASGNYAYVADGQDGLRVINVTDKLNPSLAGFYDVLLGSAHEVAAAGNYAYVTQWQRGGLHLINTGNPTVLTQTAVYNLPQYAESVAVYRNTAFVVQYNGLYSQLRSIDVSDPAAPVGGNSNDILGWATGVAASDHYVYVADGYGLRIYDSSTPAAPHQVGVYTDTLGSSMNVAVDNSFAYVANTAGLLIIDITNSTHPTLEGFYDSPDYSYAVAVDSHYAYLAAGNGLSIINIMNHANPTLVGYYSVLPGTATRVTVAGEYAYVSTGVGLEVVNVSDPTHPTQAGYYDTPGWSEGVAVVGSNIHVACGAAGLVTLQFRYAPTSATIPIGGGQLTSDGDHTTYTFPPATFTDTVIVTHTARLSSNAPSSNTLAGIDHFFDVTAVYSNTGLPPQPAASRTYTVAVEYTDAEKGPAIEGTLGLYWWTGSAWSQQGISSTVNITTNVVTAQVDHFSLFGILGETHRVNLPLVMRNQ